MDTNDIDNCDEDDDNCDDDDDNWDDNDSWFLWNPQWGPTGPNPPHREQSLLINFYQNKIKMHITLKSQDTTLIKIMDDH